MWAFDPVIVICLYLNQRGFEDCPLVSRSITSLGESISKISFSLDERLLLKLPKKLNGKCHIISKLTYRGLTLRVCEQNTTPKDILSVTSVAKL